MLAIGSLTGLAAGPPAAWADAGGAAGEAGRVVLIGVPGLRWHDLSPTGTPHLWRLAGESALGSLSVKAVGRVTCPYDGWLTVSVGVRSAVGGRCGLAPEPRTLGRGATVPGLTELAGGAGTLGSAVHDAGQCTVAAGPGAALALADGQGRVDVYSPTPAGLTADDWARCRVAAVDVDALIRPYLDRGRLTTAPERLTEAQRGAAVTAADTAVGDVLAAVPAGTSVLLAGLSDHGAVPHLRVAMWRAPGVAGRSLGAESTRRDDMVILPDITATMLTAAGLTPPPGVIGVPWAAGHRADLGDAADDLRAADVAGQTIRDVVGIFFTLLAVLQVLFYVLALLLLRRRRRDLWPLRVAALALAAIPVSTFLVNLLPWPRAHMPALAMAGGIAGCVVLLTAVALAGPWRRSPLGPPTVIAGVTAAVLLGDLLTGTSLQLNSVMGYTGVVGARYYGLGNIPFALLASAVLLVAAAFADGLVRAGRRRGAVALVAGLGCFAMILDGWPGVGSDFGGVIAFVPGIAVAALIVAGRRVSVVRLGAFCAAGGMLVMGIAYLDHLRPASAQTHLGRFVGQVLDGTFLPVIGRKLTAMLHTMISPNLMPVVVAAFAFLVFALLRPGVATAGVLPAAFERAPMLRAGLLGVLVSGVVGMLVNDSGTAVLSMALALAVPLVLSTGLSVVGDDVDGAGAAGAKAPSTSPAPVTP